MCEECTSRGQGVRTTSGSRTAALTRNLKDHASTQTEGTEGGRRLLENLLRSGHGATGIASIVGAFGLGEAEREAARGAGSRAPRHPASTWRSLELSSDWGIEPLGFFVPLTRRVGRFPGRGDYLNSRDLFFKGKGNDQVGED